MKTILISGKSGSGKDELGKYITEYLTSQNQRVLTIHFGDAVKTFLTQYYNWDGKKDEHGRKLLQLLGTDIMRKKYPTYWAEIVAKFISATSSSWDYVIIPDWRFINELNTIRHFNRNVYTVRINRYNSDNTPYINPLLTTEQREHISECELDDYSCDVFVDNYLLDDLKLSAEEVIQEINK